MANDIFEIVRSVGLALPGVESATKYDGSPVLESSTECSWPACAMHPSAEPETLVVRADVEDRVTLLEDSPETVLSHRLLPAAPGRARQDVADRPGCVARPVVDVAASDAGETSRQRLQHSHRTKPSLLRPARVLDLHALPLRHLAEAQVARRDHRIGRRRLDDGALVPRVAGEGIVRLQLELPRLLVVAAGFGDANGVRARDARGLVLVRRAC